MKKERESIPKLEQQIIENTSKIEENQLRIEKIKPKLDEKDQIIRDLLAKLGKSEVIVENSHKDANTIQDDLMVYPGERGKMVEISVQDEKFTFRSRFRQEEREGFLFWFDDLQVCACIEGLKMKVQLFEDETILSQKELPIPTDIFFRHRNKIFIVTGKQNLLFEIQVEETELVMPEPVEISSRANSFVAHEDDLFIGTNGGTILKVSNNKVSDLFSLQSIITDLTIVDDSLLAVDLKGTVARYDIKHNELREELDFCGWGQNFFVEDQIVEAGKTSFKLFNWKKEIVREVPNPTGKRFTALKTTSKETLLSVNNQLFILNWETKEISLYQGCKLDFKWQVRE